MLVVQMLWQQSSDVLEKLYYQNHFPSHLALSGNAICETRIASTKTVQVSSMQVRAFENPDCQKA